MEVLDLIGQTLWFMLPAYFANMAPVVISKFKLVKRYNKPIDFGRKWRGKPLLGPGKTWFGLISGVAVGSLIGLLQGSLELGFMLGLGAMIGDSAGSFVKRRLGLKRGAKAPGIDQLDFVLGAFLFAGLIGVFNWKYLVIALVVTPLLHWLASIAGYRLKLKREPW